MSGSQDQTPILTVKCPNCGRENAAGRLFCQFCGYRMAAHPQDEPAGKGQPDSSGEAQRLQASLQAAQDENQNMHRQIEAMQEELNKIKTASAKLEPPPAVVAELHTKLKSAEDKAATLESQSAGVVAEFQTKLKSAQDRAATLESQSAGWEQKWKSAEEKAASFERQMFAKAKEIEAAFQQHSEAKPQPNNRLKLIAGALVMVGSLGGYGAGRYVQPKDNSKEQVTQLSTQVTSAQVQIGKLTSALDEANKKANQAATDSKSQADSASQTISDLTNKLAAEHSTEAAMTQKLAQLTTSNKRIQQLETDVQSRDKELSTLRDRVANLPRPLTWSGIVRGTRTVKIDGNTADWGNLKGQLPGKPCTLTAPDPTYRVKWKTRPGPKNQWKQVSFEVTGNGDVNVQINCVSSQ